MSNRVDVGRHGRISGLWIAVRDQRLYARVGAQTGRAGPTVVLVHGAALSSRYMVPAVRQLAPWCRVYALDLPGFGRSTKPSRMLSLRELADWLLAWIEANDLRDVTLVGNSYGCQIIVDLVMRHPERVKQIVLQGPTVDDGARTWHQQIWRLLENVPSESLSQLPLILLDYWDCGIRRVVHTFQAALADQIEQRLPHVSVPALVVRGARDHMVSQRWAETVTSLLPDGRLVTVPGAAHTLNYSAPEAFARAILPFILAMPAGRHRSVGR